MGVHVEITRSSGHSHGHGLPDNTAERSEVCYRRKGFYFDKGSKGTFVHECRGVAKPLCEKENRNGVKVGSPTLSWGLFFYNFLNQTLSNYIFHYHLLTIFVITKNNKL